MTKFLDEVGSQQIAEGLCSSLNSTQEEMRLSLLRVVRGAFIPTSIVLSPVFHTLCSTLTGQDATEAFEDVGHSDEARALLPGLMVGDFEAKSVSLLTFPLHPILGTRGPMDFRRIVLT